MLYKKHFFQCVQLNFKCLLNTCIDIFMNAVLNFALVHIFTYAVVYYL